MKKTTLRPLVALGLAVATLGFAAAPASASSHPDSPRLYEIFRAQDHGEAGVYRASEPTVVSFDLTDRISPAERGANHDRQFLRFREENR